MQSKHYCLSAFIWTFLNRYFISIYSRSNFLEKLKLNMVKGDNHAKQSVQWHIRWCAVCTASGNPLWGGGGIVRISNSPSQLKLGLLTGVKLPIADMIRNKIAIEDVSYISATKHVHWQKTNDKVNEATALAPGPSNPVKSTWPCRVKSVNICQLPHF